MIMTHQYNNSPPTPLNKTPSPKTHHNKSTQGRGLSTRQLSLVYHSLKARDHAALLEAMQQQPPPTSSSAEEGGGGGSGGGKEEVRGGRGIQQECVCECMTVQRGPSQTPR